MPCCSAYGCSNRSDRGKKPMHRFPRDPQRRRMWQIQVRREGWTPKDNSFLCEDHFDETQYECHRADGLRKLKPNALPTQFVFTAPKTSRPRRPPERCRTDLGHEPPDGTRKEIRLEHSYCATTDGRQQDIIPDYQPNHADLDLTSNTPPNASCSCETAGCGERLKALTDKVSRLQQTLAKERREKWKILKQRKQLEEKVSSVFNKDQLAKLNQSSTRGTKWSADTIKKGLQLKFACGATGYELLLAQNQPLPSARSLRRRQDLYN